MVDISILKDYYCLDDTIIASTKHELKSSPVEKLLVFLLNSIDCTRTINEKRFIETISYRYIRFVTQYIYIVDNYIKDINDKNKWFTDILVRHTNNIEFEKENPPKWYDGEKGKKRAEKKIKSAIANRSKKERKDKGPTKAELKLVAKVAKINKLNFKINGTNISS